MGCRSIGNDIDGTVDIDRLLIHIDILTIFSYQFAVSVSNFGRRCGKKKGKEGFGAFRHHKAPPPRAEAEGES